MHGKFENSSVYQLHAGPGPVITDESKAFTLRDYFAAHAPVPMADAVTAHGRPPNLSDDDDVTRFFGEWAALRYMYADAMMQRRDWCQ